MAALTAPRTYQFLEIYPHVRRRLPVAGGVVIWKGALVVLDAGFLKPITTETPYTLFIPGIASDTLDTTGLEDGDAELDVEAGIVGFDRLDDIDNTKIGQQVFASDDHTATTDSSNNSQSQISRVTLTPAAGQTVGFRFSAISSTVTSVDLETDLDALNDYVNENPSWENVGSSEITEDDKLEITFTDTSPHTFADLSTGAANADHELVQAAIAPVNYVRLGWVYALSSAGVFVFVGLPPTPGT
jgi:hypothetical protein